MFENENTDGCNKRKKVLYHIRTSNALVLVELAKTTKEGFVLGWHDGKKWRDGEKKKEKGIYGKASKQDLKELNEEGISTQVIPWIEDKNN